MGDLLSAVGSVGSSVVNALYDNYQQNRQREWNEQMMDKQNAWSLDMWNRTNEYNSPSAQIARLHEAGLNPLYYGLDGSSANAFQSAQPLGYERSTSPLVNNPVDAIYNTRLKNAQIDNINADTAKKNNETITETERRQNLIKERDEMDSRIKKNIADANLSETMKAKAEQYMEYADEMYQAQIDRDNAAAGLSNEQANRIRELLPGEKELQNMSIEDYKRKWVKWNAEIRHLAAQDALLGKQMRYYLVSLLTSGVYGSGVSAVNGYIMSLINEDNDLSPKEKDDLEKVFVVSKKPKSNVGNARPNDPRDYTQYDGSGWSDSKKGRAHRMWSEYQSGEEVHW